MSQRYSRDNGNMAAAIFAVTFVVIGGLGICSAVSVTFSSSPTKSILVVCGIFFFLTMILGRILFGKIENRSANRNVFWILGRNHKETEMEYVPEVKRKKRRSQPPPSVEGIRNLKDSTNNWVPTGKPSTNKK